MAIYTLDQITEIIVKNPNQNIVDKARKFNKKAMLHTHGVGLKDAIKREDYFENADIYKSRSELAISNKDMMARTLNEEDQVFTARGGSSHFQLPDSQENVMNELLSDVRYGISLRQWVKTFGLQAYRNDPMGVLFMEVEEIFEADGVQVNTPECYPTYKSTAGIYDYLPNGRRLEHICFQLSVSQLIDFGIEDKDFTMFPENGRIAPKDKQTPYYRFVDDEKDMIVKRDNEKIFIVTSTKQKNPIRNAWSRLPAFIVSDLINFADPECFGSPLQFVIELCDTFLTDRTVRDLQKKYHGFAKAVEPMLKCSTCGGEGQVKGSACPDCTPPGANRGTGYKLRTKLSEVAKFPIEILETIPNFDFRKIFGYATPDIESWKQQDASLDQLEQLIYYTYWGVGKSTQIQGAQAPSKLGDKTAYEIGANLKPKYARLNATADWAEKTENLLADFIGEYWITDYKTGGKPISYGRNYILETPDDLINRYYDMRLNGAPDFLLDDAMERYLRCLYEGSPVELAKKLKLLQVEPMAHINMTDAKTLAPRPEDFYGKFYFDEWYKILKDVYIIETPPEKMRADLEAYVKAKDIPPPAPVIPLEPDKPPKQVKQVDIPPTPVNA